ncbi:hypothetical protein SAMN04487895_101741 [Paenibacillus sophorae]|uniref:Uncharacterized protein n=1 Tax=Paenibacillus sophorae TaxID=1333845 RepID=A0A1H8H2L0_9BACL|nr:hypothetical protein [Paenibacillus sophorae]QWU14429.1 hypothetical protein KP014_21210 [Paenibacillus sophorae]SEN50631.1 hypothetical protein SAMN04487895_101741 [Paenibacillus sophorae]
MNKKQELNLKLNSFVKTDDPTLLKATYIILDFDKSWNNSVVSKEVALELGETIINKPLVARYIPVEEPNTNTDNFTGHEAKISTNKYGDKTVITDTVPIGVFTTKGYLLTVEENGEDKEVLAADAVLWRSRFSDACDLLLEWYNRGININTSCEFLYSNFSVQDGVEYINSPVYFEGHCHLAAEERGEQGVVLPAYDSSKLLSFNEFNMFNKLIAESLLQSKNNIDELEGEKVLFKKVFELSHSDIRSKIYQVLDPTLPDGTYSYIIDTYDNHFVVELDDADGYKYYDFAYSKTEDDQVVIDFDSKAEVVEKREWVKLDTTVALQTQLNESKNTIKDLEIKLSEANGSIKALTTEKTSLNEANTSFSNEITTLRAEVETLKPYKENYEAEELNKSINEMSSFYSAKFSAVSAIEKFESEEVQNLIKNSVYDSEVGTEAKFKLNNMLVELMQVETETPKPSVATPVPIREFSSRMENLIPASNDFDSKYK